MKHSVVIFKETQPVQAPPPPDLERKPRKKTPPPVLPPPTDAASMRLCSLPMNQQIYFAEKYYGGIMPWREVGEK